MKPMKLEGALKLYMVLYFLAFLATFMMSVPMLLHVVPLSECLLFVDYSYDQNRKFTYGPPGGEIGYLNILPKYIISVFSQDVTQPECCLWWWQWVP